MLNACTSKMLFDAAQSSKFGKGVKRYIELKEMFAESGHVRSENFRSSYSQYYGLLSAGLTTEWLNRHFELLYEFDQTALSDPYRHILLELYDFPRREGDKVLQFSFASKLDAFHDESRPLYDAKVRKFFGLGPPELKASLEFRISGFITNLSEIARRYEEWQQDQKFADLLGSLCAEYDGLTSVQLCDFLVHRAAATWDTAAGRNSK